MFNGFVKRNIPCLKWLIVVACCGWMASSCVNNGREASRQPSSGKEKVKVGPYGYASGILEFRIRRPFHQVNETVYFTEWGRKEARYETVYGGILAGKSAPRHQITLISPEGFFSWQVETREGSRSPLPPQEPFQDFDTLKKRLGAEAATKRLRHLGIRLLPEEMVLGFPCYVFQSKGGTFWIHRGLLLRSRIRLPNFTTIREAVRFVPDAAVNPDRFRFPPGVDPESFPDLSELLRNARSKDKKRTSS